MTKVTVDPGICGFPIIIKAESSDMQNVKIDITTGCPNIKNAISEIDVFDAYKELFTKLSESNIYHILSKYVPHPSCVIYSGILKAIEVETGLSLPKDVTIKIEKNN